MHGLLLNFGPYRFEIREFTCGERSVEPLTDGPLSPFSALFAFFGVDFTIRAQLELQR
jgi:hypothetical protein